MSTLHIHPRGGSGETLGRGLGSRLLVAVGLLTALLGAGTLGFHLIEGWSWWDSFYMVVITASTVGFGEVHELSRPGELFTVIVVAGGVAVGSYALLVVTRTFFEGVVEGSLQRAFARRKMEKAIPKLSGHAIVCGFGHVGREICVTLAAGHRRVVVVEKSEEAVIRAQQDGFLAIRGDAADELILRDAGITRAGSLVIATSSDAINTYVVLMARELNPGLHVLSRATEEGAERRLRAAGADSVVAPNTIGGQRMASLVLRPGVVDFLDRAFGDFPDLALEEIVMASGSELAGKTLREADYSARFKVLVLAVVRTDGERVFNPKADSNIAEGDRIIVAGNRVEVEALEAALRG